MCEDSDGGIDKWSCPAGSCRGKVLRPMLCSPSVKKLSGVFGVRLPDFNSLTKELQLVEECIRSIGQVGHM